MLGVYQGNWKLQLSFNYSHFSVENQLLLECMYIEETSFLSVARVVSFILPRIFGSALLYMQCYCSVTWTNKIFISSKYFFSIVSCTTGWELNSQEMDILVASELSFLLSLQLFCRGVYCTMWLHMFCTVAVMWKWHWSWVAVSNCIGVDPTLELILLKTECHLRPF